MRRIRRLLKSQDRDLYMNRIKVLLYMNNIQNLNIQKKSGHLLCNKKDYNRNNTFKRKECMKRVRCIMV